MSKKVLLLLIIISMLFIFLLSGCTSKSVVKVNSDSNTISITDMLGRDVLIKSAAKKVVAIGPGALRLYCYVGGVEKISGIEQIEKDNATGRPYILANPSLTNLQIIGAGGPNNSPDAEKILELKPDVIFTTYVSDKSAADNLQSKTGIPVVAISYGKVSAFDPNVYESIKIIGKTIGDEKRAQQVVEFMKKCENDLDNRTKGISNNQKPNTYVGALSMKGLHGIESTQGNYSLFNAVHALNVVDETGRTGSFMIDKEKLIVWNPDKIFIDFGGLTIVKADYKKNLEFYKTLTAFNSGEVYSLLPYNFYSTNIDTAMADAYYIGKVLYPEKFKDIDIEKKANEIYKFLLGKEVYSQMTEDFGELEEIMLE
jgi:iron complex transport system substrate-binding protein